MREEREVSSDIARQAEPSSIDIDLNSEERGHVNSLSEEESELLGLSSQACVITLTGLNNVVSPPGLYEPEGIVYLLLLVTARKVQWAVDGLSLGYYDAAWAILRAALDSIQYAALFWSKPGSRELWLRASFAPAEPESRRRMQADLANRARTEFARLTGRHDVALRDRIQRQFRADACASVHSTPDGLAYRFGLDMFAFLPDGFEDDLKATAGDFEHAFALMRLRESPARVNAVNKRSSEVVTHEIDLSATLPDMLHEQSYFALYIAHPMLDLVAHQFHIQDAAFRHDYNLWHKQLRRFLGV